jgi:hypothetical protein
VRQQPVEPPLYPLAIGLALVEPERGKRESMWRTFWMWISAWLVSELRCTTRPIMHPVNGKMPVPTLYDISGSAHWTFPPDPRAR